MEPSLDPDPDPINSIHTNPHILMATTNYTARLKFLSYQPFEVDMFTDHGVFTTCPDTGTGIMTISQPTFTHYYAPTISPILMPGTQAVGMEGVGGGHLSSHKFANISMCMKDTEGQPIYLHSEYHIVTTLTTNILISMEMLSKHGVVIDTKLQQMIFPNRQCVQGQLQNQLTTTKPIRPQHLPQSEKDPPGPNLAIPEPKSNIQSTDIPKPNPEPTNTPPPRPHQSSSRCWECFTVHTTETKIIQPSEGVHLKISHHNLPNAGPWLLLPQLQNDLHIGLLAGVPCSIIDNDMMEIPYANLGKIPVQITNQTIIGHASLTNTSHCTELTATINLVSTDPADLDDSDNIWNPFAILMEDPNTNIDSADVSDSFGTTFQNQIWCLLTKHKQLFWKELGMFNDDVCMPIPFCDEQDVSKLKQAPYHLSQQDQQEMDNILNPLIKDGWVEKVPLGKPSPVVCPAFIAWNKGKPCVVVDLCKVNAWLIPNTYPLPWQDDILAALSSSKIFSSMDVTKGFFQQWIVESDHWKTVFVSQHWGQEQLTVATMGLTNSPGFFQHHMEDLLSDYLWSFVLVYVDNIIVFSSTLEEHLQHLDMIFSILEKSGVSLSLKKCHFSYPTMHLLGHKVSWLGISTSDEKVTTIHNLHFPTTLADLETTYGLFSYYHKFIHLFATIAKPIERLKTLQLKQALVKGYAWKLFTSKDWLDDPNEPLEICQLINSAWDAWHKLQWLITSELVLAHPNFHHNFKLYCNGSICGFGVAIHQVGEDGIEHPVLYLSHSLKPHKKHYWVTELECAALCWALHCMPQYFDNGNFTVITDHSALVSTLQLQSDGWCSQWLNKWALFLASYLPHMTIKHWKGSTHSNADTLSHFPPSANLETDPDPAEKRDLHNILVQLSTTTASVELGPDEISKLKDALLSDKGFKCIMERLQNQLLTDGVQQYQNFELQADLLYHTAPDKPCQLCILSWLASHIFHMVHEIHGHPGLHWTYQQLCEVYFIPQGHKGLTKFIQSCISCQLGKPSWHKPYSQMNPITTPSQPFDIFSIDFIVGLPESAGFNALLVMTEKFSRAVHLTPGKETWSAEEWADAFFDTVYCEWGLPECFISDCDSKFLGEFWQQLLRDVGVKQQFTTAYNPQSNGQSECSNQMVKIILWCLLVGKYTLLWSHLLPQVQWDINSLTNTSMGISPNEVLYRINIWSIPAHGGNTMDTVTWCKDLQQAIQDTSALVQAWMADIFDAKHQPLNLHNWVFICYAWSTQKGYHLPQLLKLNVLKASPFQIIEKVGPLAYCIELPLKWKIHNVISVAHLEQAHRPPSSFHTNNPPPIPVEGTEQYEVEKIVKQEDRQGKKWMLIKWKGYKELTWQEWEDMEEDIPQMVKRFDEKCQPKGRCTLTT